MSALIRYIIILLVFFGILFYFRQPLQAVPGYVANLKSPYVAGFKNVFNEIIMASSTTVLNGQNYVPSPAGTATSSTSTVSLEDAGLYGSPYDEIGGINPSSSSSVLSAEQDLAFDDNTKTTTSPTESALQEPISDMGAVDTGELSPVTSDEEEEQLSATGVIAYTNNERTQQGLPALKQNTDLTTSAENKLQDMFKNQYFQHISPTGESVSGLATQAGYEYIVVGENLALGIFSGDSAVVAAWMASPAHRRNILDARYQDIGVAVGEGMYQGRKQWLIVEHLGKPLSACTEPSVNLKNNIGIEKNNASDLETQITSLKAEISDASGDQYTVEVSQYNALVTKYNTTITLLEKDINTYNVSARAFNQCAGVTDNQG